MAQRGCGCQAPVAGSGEVILVDEPDVNWARVQPDGSKQTNQTGERTS